MTARPMNAARSLPAMLVAAVLVCAACGSSPIDAPVTPATSAENPYEEQRTDAVEDLLQRWSDAVRSGDGDELTDVLDRSATPEFFQSELRRSESLAAVPLDDWGYELVDEPETPVPPALAASLDAADVWAPSVVLRYAVSGPDREPTRRPVSLLLAKRDEHWRIVSDAEIPGIDRRTWRGPWDFGPVTSTSVTTSGGNSTIVGHPDQAALIDRIVTELPAAVDAVTDFYGNDWPRRALIFTSGSTEEFGASAGDTSARLGVAAVTVSDAVAADRPVTGQRVVFGPEAPGRLTEFTTRSVLRHELTHVAARADTVDGSPTWVLEGFADYAGYRGSGVDFGRLAPTLSRVVASGGPPTVLPEDSDFAAGGSRSTLAYESAWSVCAYVADRYGEPALRALYRALATGPKTASDIDGALTAVVGATSAEFLRGWGSWVQGRSR
ncbi:DUF4157 domain-containing protein [Rhodococcus sp. G-MC3]|uniref:peptidase MA family metallohydrolase n=1 Tax=Rhodococcus sp. G-MC3 TaxID=3046209 RepID=UPI0024B90D23|nr:DUF4157 domain-containing protein [Rhodococcus sp. G-MC3]MDJ0393055.1 DUF4157 domain-containing protein [Rhodococcus sp. G-MC3]